MNKSDFTAHSGSVAEGKLCGRLAVWLARRSGHTWAANHSWLAALPTAWHHSPSHPTDFLRLRREQAVRLSLVGMCPLSPFASQVLVEWSWGLLVGGWWWVDGYKMKKKPSVRCSSRPFCLTKLSQQQCLYDSLSSSPSTSLKQLLQILLISDNISFLY